MDSAFASAVGIRCPCSPHLHVTPPRGHSPVLHNEGIATANGAARHSFRGTPLSEGLVHGYRWPLTRRTGMLCWGLTPLTEMNRKRNLALQTMDRMFRAF